MDTCIVLNFGYDAPLPWPQVSIWWFYKYIYKIQITNKQVSMNLDDEDSEDNIKLVPGSHGMNVPSTCTIVIIAGK